MPRCCSRAIACRPRPSAAPARRTPEAYINIEQMRVVHRKGWEWEAVREGDQATEEERMR